MPPIATQMKPWIKILAQGALIAAALGVLAWIGRVASAGAVVNVAALDGGAPVIDAATPPPPPPPSVPSAPSAPTGPRARATPEAPVLLNEADADELQRLPGVGPKRASAILAQRQRTGRFRRIEELLRVKGVGRATLRRWRPLVRLEAVVVDAGAQASAPRTAASSGPMTSERSL